MLFNPSRDEARRFFIQSWQKHTAGAPLADLERIVVAVLLRHPEYHRYLSEDYLDRDWPPEVGETNPFLHLSMHLAIEEQLSIDQPLGVKAQYTALCAACGDEHSAQHQMMDGLGEMIWHAQRSQSAPDPAIYLDILRTKVRQFGGKT
ncbi:DUF1841 family protein [Jeongeupia chitinilytica]|uniref:DUF1841 family protein n=1 Tax=Jeongeupia chitinilytica TaxID=1041641 RepID=A0ABQ3GVN1_9NEIS|nr:DUF1841 family protein [Jeongeupia chitinilytica]GHD55782.1 hypothetical protein GCM10007350_01850 [Jeongeupia chitinilytica]